MHSFSVVVMGVAGCGKSSLGREVAAKLGWPMVEGDDFHGPENKALMAAGTPLTDANRAGWLDTLAAELGRYPGGVVLSCSALKQRYRDQLRAASTGLRFVYLELSPEAALARVSGRGGGHFFPAALVASQFEGLETPAAERGVLCLDATLSLDALLEAALDWIHHERSPR
ncbi:MAG TPA: gluconokinase [Burkholderiaceae bacterium]|jgi:gluconokinase